MEQGGRSQLAHLSFFFSDPFRQHPAIYHTWFSVFPEHNEARTTQVCTLINFAAGLDFTLTVGGLAHGKYFCQVVMLIQFQVCRHKEFQILHDSYCFCSRL